MTCCYEKPVWRTCDLAGKDKVFDLSYDVLIVAVGIALLTFQMGGPVSKCCAWVCRPCKPCAWP